MKGNSTYFARRAREERDAAAKASHPAAQQAHRDMAQRYEQMGSDGPILKLVGAKPSRVSR
jgi:hypothetical protein